MFIDAGIEADGTMCYRGTNTVHPDVANVGTLRIDSRPIELF